MKSLFNRSFVSVVFAQIASLFGDAVLRFALPLYVLNLTGSAALMGAVAAAAWLPYIVLTPIGGVAADRVNKRRIMAVLDVLLALTCAAYLALEGTVDLIGLSICALIILYAAQSVYQPTVQAAVPFIVPRGDIVRATAIVSQISALSGLVGPVIGGLVFGLFGIEPVVMVSGIAFAVSAALMVVVVRIPRDVIERSDVCVVRTVARDIAESFAFLRHERPVILKVIFLVAGINLTLTAFIIIGAPVTVTQILGLPNQYMGFAEGAMALGGLAGGITVGVLAKRMRLERAALFLLVAAVALVPMAVVLGVPMDPLLAYGLFVGCLFVSMACATMFSIQAISFVQLETPAHLIGKVIALTMALANCAQPVGQLLYGRPVRRLARRPGARGVGHGGRGVRFGTGDVARAWPRLARTAQGRGGCTCVRGRRRPATGSLPISGDSAQPERHGAASLSRAAALLQALRAASVLSSSGELTLCQKCRLTRRHHGDYTRANTDEPPFEQATRLRMERRGQMPVRGCSGKEGLMGSAESSTVFADRANDAATGASTRRDDIVEAARELYEERGLSRTTVKDITQRVGVTRSAVLSLLLRQGRCDRGRPRRHRGGFSGGAALLERRARARQRRQGAHGLPAHLPQRHLRERVVPAKSGEHRELGALPAFRADRGRPGGALHRRFDRARLRAVPQRGDRARLRDVLHDDRRHDGTHQGESPY